MTKNCRHNARRAAVQALYQWDMTQQNPAVIEENFIPGTALEEADTDYFKELIDKIPRKVGELDEVVATAVSRSLDNVDPIERNILRLGVYSLKYELAMPWKVVVNECVELARIFGTEQGYRFINGVMDTLARSLRAAERVSDKAE